MSKVKIFFILFGLFVLYKGYTAFRDFEIGVGTLDHLYDGIVKGGASAVLAASIFHYGEYKIKDAKEYLNSKNVSVRL